MAENLKLVLWVNAASQPSRSIIAFCRLNNIAHEVKMVDMGRGQHRKEPFTKINPAEQVPAMQEVDAKTGETVFVLSESHTIMRYLHESRGCADHWYPKDLKKRALVDMYLDQHHTYMRAGVAGFVFKRLFSPGMTGRAFEDKELDFHRIMFKRSMRIVEERLTKNTFLCGPEPTIADISAACELD